MADMVQMNTRIPLELKVRGDEVLARSGKTASDAIRSLWRYMADNQRVPSVLDGSAVRDDAAFEAKRAQIHRSSLLLEQFYASQGIASSFAEAMAPDSYDVLRENMYERMLSEYEALDA